MSSLPRSWRIWPIQSHPNRLDRNWSSSSARHHWRNGRRNPRSCIYPWTHRRGCSLTLRRLEMAVQYEVCHHETANWTMQTANISSVPFGLVTILAITNLWPDEQVSSLFSWDAFTRIDFVGGGALLCSSGLLVFAVQQAGSQTFAWNSPVIISTLAISGLSWIAFIVWEVQLEVRGSKRVEPVFPIRLMLNRVYTAGLL